MKPDTQRGAATTWLIIGLLAILVIAELGFGSFLYFNKKNIEQADLEAKIEEAKRPKLTILYPSGGEKIFSDEYFLISGNINIPYETDGKIKISIIFPDGNETDDSEPSYSNKYNSEFSVGYQVGIRYNGSVGYYPTGDGFKVRATFLSSDGKIKLEAVSEPFSVIGSPVVFIDHFDNPNEEREIFSNVYFQEDGENFQPKLGLGKIIYFAGGFVREPTISFLPTGQNWTEGTVDLYLNSFNDYIPDKDYIIHFTSRNINEGEKSTGFVSEYIAAIFLNNESRIEVSCGNGVSIKSMSSIPIREWRHVVLTWSRIGGFTRLYINDELAAKSDKSCDLVNYGKIYPWLGGYGLFFGWMDELKIANVAEAFNKDSPFLRSRVYIALTYPGGGEILERGKTYKIKWNSGGLSQVYFEVSAPLGPISSVEWLDKNVRLSKNIADEGFYDWTVPKDMPPGKYLITINGSKLVNSKDALIFDMSDVGSYEEKVFTIR